MTTRYSPSTGNFYPLEIDYQTLPDDLVEVPKSDYETAMNRPAGFGFHFSDGNLIITEPVPEGQQEILQRALADIRKQRSPILDALAGIGFDALMSGDTATAQAVATARSGLKSITSLPALVQASTYEEMKLIVLNEYRLIAAAAPLSVQKAFLEVIAS